MKSALAVIAGPLLLALTTFHVVDGVCTTYEQDVEVASQLPDNCAYNTYMCCWTGYDGPGGMVGNTDVCRVLDYPNEGDTFEYPRDDEGPVYCHGFAWGLDYDLEKDILEVYHDVVNTGCTPDGGYFGNLEGVPECGCIEDMPVVANAECSRAGMRDDDPPRDCGDGMLRNQYAYSSQLDKPKGNIDWNLVSECDNDDAPEFDFNTCTENTYMCCWTENDNRDGNGMQDNTDVCAVGGTEYPDESEGEVHCHGFVWPEDANDAYIVVLAQFVQHFDHRDKRGYTGNLEGAPMCDCIENMPIVSEADCTTYDETKDGSMSKCTGNDLRTRFEEEFGDRELGNLIDDCANLAALPAADPATAPTPPTTPAPLNETPAPVVDETPANRAALTPASVDPTYVGCYADDKEDRVLSHKVTMNNMIAAVCGEYCSDKGAKYYGTQYSTECWCGTSDNRDDYERHGSGTCDMDCIGDASANEKCGGRDAFSLYTYANDETPAPVVDETPAPVVDETPAPVV